MVATTCRGSKAEQVRALGADVVVDYSDPLQPQLADVVRDFDVVFDTLGKPAPVTHVCYLTALTSFAYSCSSVHSVSVHGHDSISRKSRVEA